MNQPGRVTVLLVEENSLLASTLKTYLEENCPLPLRVDLEERGDTAVDRILAEQPDLVLLDLGLPGLDGFEVCERVRQGYRGAIIVLTADRADEAQLKGLGLGADDHLVKPVRVEILLARILAVLRRTRKARPGPVPGDLADAGFGEEPLELGPWCLQPRGRTATFNGVVLELSTKEFDLLWLLARNPGFPVGRERIHQVVCGGPWDGKGRAVDLVVQRLRRKLGPRPARERWIRTVSGVGYLLAPE